MKILELIRDRKWDTLLILTLLVIVGVTVPIWLSVQMTGFAEATNKPIYELLVIHDNRITKEAERNDLLRDIVYRMILGAAVAGYSKIGEDVTKFQDSSQNAQAIKLGLGVPEVRAELYFHYPTLTLLYEEHFRLTL